MRKIKLRTVIIFGFAALSAAALLHVSQRVQHAEDELASINAKIMREEETIRVLKAEWQFLNRPERLEQLSTEFLELVPPSPKTLSDTMMGQEVAPLPARTPSQVFPSENAAKPVSFGADVSSEGLGIEMPLKPSIKPKIAIQSPPQTDQKTDRGLETLLNELTPDAEVVQ